MNQVQIEALREIERQLQVIWAAEVPPGPPVLSVTDGNLNAAIRNAPDGAIIDLAGQALGGDKLVLDRPVTLRNGSYTASPNLNDLVEILGPDISLLNMRFYGDGTTRRGIAWNGTNTLIDGCEVRNIRRVLTESAALGGWNGTGLTVRNSVLEGASQSVLIGGSGTTIPDHVPSDILFDTVLFTRDPAWRSESYAAKTVFELKNARRVRVVNSVLENMWAQGQTGIAVTLTPSNYDGRSPNTVVEDVEINNNIIRNVGGGLSILGFTQHPERPTLRANNIRILNNQFSLSKTLYGGQGALLQLGWEPADIVVDNNIVVTDGDAFIRVTDRKAIAGFSFQHNTVTGGMYYGIFSPLGSRGAAFQSIFPNGVLSLNVFGGTPMSSIFRGNFPENTYV